VIELARERGRFGDLSLIDGPSRNAIWDSEAALMTSVSQADELRKRATQPSATTIESVQHYEIPVMVGAPASRLAASRRPCLGYEGTTPAVAEELALAGPDDADQGDDRQRFGRDVSNRTLLMRQ
jgi:hypothetical protein